MSNRTVASVAYRFAIGFALLVGCSTPQTSETCVPACAGGFRCENGACVADGSHSDGGTLEVTCNPACGGLTPYCNATHHCVGCTTNAQCPVGEYCKTSGDAIATCTIGCVDDSRCGGGTCCDGHCVDTTSDPARCGACDKSCAAMHSEPMCVASMCQPGACNGGWGDCNADAKDGCEANLHVDAANCTACGMACQLPNAISACSDGCYLAACNFGYDDCNSDDSDGCETSVISNPQNCGGCGAACPPPPHGSASCQAGSCLLASCNPGYVDCNGDAKDGCEANLQFDSKNCGQCGNQCPMQTPACNGGNCTSGFAGLFAYWKFDGDGTDTVGNHNLSAAPQGQMPGFVAGKVGMATNSPMGDPQNMWLSPMPAEINNSADFTVAFWARTNTHSWYDSYAAWDSGGVVIYRHQQQAWRFIVFTQDPNGGNGANLDSGVNIPGPDNAAWYLVIVYRSGNTLGIRINDNPPVTSTVGPLKQGPVLYVSRMTSGYSWPGQLDEMGYWTRALSVGEMDQIYNNGDGRTFP